MANSIRKKGLFKNVKTRILFFLIVFIILAGAAILYVGFKNRQQGFPTGTQLTGAPNIKSIPGSGQSTPEYAKSVNIENIKQAQEAGQTGGSAVPTLVKPTYQGPTEFGPSASSGHPDCTPEALRRARMSGVKADELRCKGCTAAELRAAGYTAGELRNAGFTAAQLKGSNLSCKDLLDAGYNETEIKNAGYSQAELAVCLPSLITSAKLPAGFPKDCSVSALQEAHNKGISAAEIKKTLGCSAAAFKAGGYSAKELKDAGFTAGQLRQAGFSANPLKGAAFTPNQLRTAGYNAQELKDAGFSPDQLKAAGFSDGDLARAGFPSAAPLLQAGGISSYFPTDCGVDSLKQAQAAGVPMSEIQQRLGCSNDALAAAGYRPAEAAKQPSSLASISSTQPDQTAAFLDQLRKEQTHQLSAQERQNATQQLQQAMGQQASDLLSAWSPPTTQTYVAGEEEKIPKEALAQGGTTVAGAEGGRGEARASGEEGPPGRIIKAGTVYYGILDTGINSDQQSPIRARIVSGPLKNSILIGQFVRVEKRVVLSFSTINIRNVPKSLSLNAVAIDPNTAQTALRDDVNSHYLLRYGSLIASAFVSGVSQAIMQSGSTTVNLSDGSVTRQSPTLSGSQQILVGLGNVGTQYANVLSQNFSKPPTVCVYQGAEIGVLFMNDLTVPISGPKVPSNGAG